MALLAASLAVVAAHAGGFAIVVDSESWNHCQTEIQAYAQSVREDGLDAFISAQQWNSPEQVKDSLLLWKKTRNLEGCVFVGNIPIPMIRKAQHLTSAFKMDEEYGGSRRDTSVPSDRFYDDFDLRFRSLGRDSVETQFFYYEMAPESPQEIHCDIYSGRIRTSDHFQDRYAELSAYLDKLVRVRRETNRLDHVVSYTGEGSFSDCMIAWKDETVTLSEQIPEAFNDIDGAKFFVFGQYPFMKDVVLEACADDRTDLVLFHCHGTPERQWIQNLPPADTEESYAMDARYRLRESARGMVRRGKTPEQAVGELVAKWNVDSSWVAEAFDPETALADSLYDLKTGIVLEDVWKTKPNARMYIFDACYNGDFRENDYIAGRYIFSGGNSVVGIGNTVNVLQDKASSIGLNLLTEGVRVGDWHARSAILESHVIGDPAFRFAPASVKSRNGYMERLYALTELGHSADVDAYRAALRASLEDPYEYIRRKAAYYLCRVGRAEDAEALVHAYQEDYNAKRVAFNIEHNSAMLPDSSFVKAMPSAPAAFFSSLNLKAYGAEAVFKHGNGSKTRRNMLKIFRNNPYPEYAESLVLIVKDSTEPLEIRITCAEALGWYTEAWNRSRIVDALEGYDSGEPSLQDEITRTIGRLKVYLK